MGKRERLQVRWVWLRGGTSVCLIARFPPYILLSRRIGPEEESWLNDLIVDARNANPVIRWSEYPGARKCGYSRERREDKTIRFSFNWLYIYQYTTHRSISAYSLTSQIRAVPSSLPVNTFIPSGENATDST